MPETIPNDSVGIVSPVQVHFDQPLPLRCGRTLPSYDLTYEAYGTLNKARDNAILVCHALSGHHHAAGYHHPDDRKAGWWDNLIGPGKVVDTNYFYVVCCNNLGGCHGSTGPTAINPETGAAYGPEFPMVTVEDWVDSQAQLADHLLIEQWAAVIGGSLGGMQALTWSVRYPERLRHCIAIATAPRLTAQNIAFNEIARRAIRSDPDFHDGNYASHDTSPKRGLALARMIGHVTYLSDDMMGVKFGRDRRSDNDEFEYHFDAEFQVESYLRYQGDTFAGTFDANTYLLMTKVLDYYDLASANNDDLSATLAAAKCKFLLMSFSSDWRFSPERSREIVNALISADQPICYAEIEAEQGHDAFLLKIQRYLETFSTYMEQVKVSTPTISSPSTTTATALAAVKTTVKEAN